MRPGLACTRRGCAWARARRCLAARRGEDFLDDDGLEGEQNFDEELEDQEQPELEGAPAGARRGATGQCGRDRKGRAEAAAVTAHRRARDDRGEDRRAGAVAAVEQQVVRGGGRVTDERDDKVRASEEIKKRGPGQAAVRRRSGRRPQLLSLPRPSLPHSPRCGRARPCTSMRWRG